MQNRHMERSAAYSGIVGAILYIISGLVGGVPPPATAGSATIAGYVGAHSGALLLSAWLTLPAVAFILWFAFGLFDYLRSANDADRTLAYWGAAGAIVWGALNFVAVALMAAAAILQLGATASFPLLYVFDITLFIFGAGAFAAFAFAAANEARRHNAMPGWINAFGYLVFIVDLLFTLSIFPKTGQFSIAGIGTLVTPIISAVWVFFAAIALLGRVPKTA